MQATFNCDSCNNETTEDYEVYNANNPRKRGKFFSTCDRCTKKAKYKREWIAEQVRSYEGWLGPIGRSFAAFKAGYEFERDWIAANYLAKKMLKPKPSNLAERFKELRKLGDNPILVTAQENDMNNYTTATKLLTLIIERGREFVKGDPGWGVHLVRWDGHDVQIECQKYEQTRFLLNGVPQDLGQINDFLRIKQIANKFTGLELRNFGGVWTLTAIFDDEPAPEVAAEAEAIDPAKPADGFEESPISCGEAPGPWQAEALRAVMHGVDLADGRDYSVFLSYKRVGELETGKVKFDVVGVARVEQADPGPMDVKVQAAPGADPEAVKRTIQAAIDEHGGKRDREAVKGEGSEVDFGYGSEFDKAMLAVYDALEEYKGTRLSHLLSKKSWNDFYHLAKEYRQRHHEKGA